MRKVGKVKAAHGLRGDIYVFVFSGDISWLPQLEKLSLFSASGELQYELAIEKTKPYQKGFLARIQGVADRTAAEKLHGLFVYIPEDLLVSQPGEEIYLSEIEGFRMSAEGYGDQGVIAGFSSNGVQDLLVIEEGDLRYEVPFVEDFIVRLDFDHRVVHLELPPGLKEMGERVKS